MTAHRSTGVVVIERFTQDGYDWPNPNPAPEPAQPMAPYFRAQLLEDSEVQMADVPQPRAEHLERQILGTKRGLCALKFCHCARYGTTGKPALGCEHCF